MMGLVRRSGPRAWAAGIVAILSSVSAFAASPSWPVALLIIATSACGWMVWSMFDKRDEECRSRLRETDRIAKTAHWGFIRVYFWTTEQMALPASRRAKKIPPIETFMAPPRDEEVHSWKAHGAPVE